MTLMVIFIIILPFHTSILINLSCASFNYLLNRWGDREKERLSLVISVDYFCYLAVHPSHQTLILCQGCNNYYTSIEPWISTSSPV